MSTPYKIRKQAAHLRSIWMERIGTEPRKTPISYAEWVDEVVANGSAERSAQVLLMEVFSHDLDLPESSVPNSYSDYALAELLMAGVA